MLIALGSLGRLDLLEERFPEGIVVPAAVWQEVVETGAGRAGAAAVATAKWITVEAVRDGARVREQLDALRRRGKFRISQTLYAVALRAVGEE